MAKSIGFYQSFGLDLQRIGSIISCIANTDAATYDEIGSVTHLNRRAVEGAVQWARHIGLVGVDTTRGRKSNYNLTSFGNLVALHDLEMQHRETLWLFHYYLVTDQEERSEAWYRLFNHFIPRSPTFTLREFQAYFAESVIGETKNKKALQEDPRQALQTYMRPQALEPLELLRNDGEQYSVNEHLREPAAEVLAFMLFDWWDRRFPHSEVLTLAQLTEEDESPGRVFAAHSARVKSWVQLLRSHRWLTFSDTQHQPVNRLFSGDPVTLLESYYHGA